MSKWEAFCDVLRDFAEDHMGISVALGVFLVLLTIVLFCIPIVNIILLTIVIIGGITGLVLVIRYLIKETRNRYNEMKNRRNRWR